LDPFAVYQFIKTHFFELISLILAVVGFALRFRGYRKQSTLLILFVYFIIYVLPALL